MPNRRDVVLGGSAALAALTGGLGASAAPKIPGRVPSGRARLETRMFNFKVDVSPEKTAEIIGKMKDLAKDSGVDGFMVGKNLSPDLFPTRFGWLYMIQFPDFAPRSVDPAYRRFERVRHELASLCRNAVECDLSCPLPPRFADAAGVTVRHTVMFDFKPDAPQEARERNVEAIRQMGKLPMVRHYLVQRTTAPIAGPIQMEWQVVGDYASLADYEAYSNAPVHLAIRDDFTAHTSRVAFLDVALGA
jgi:hypothetical protein